MTCTCQLPAREALATVVRHARAHGLDTGHAIATDADRYDLRPACPCIYAGIPDVNCIACCGTGAPIHPSKARA